MQKKKYVLMLEMLFFTVFFANLYPCVIMLFSDSCLKPAETGEVTNLLIHKRLFLVL